MHQRLIQAPPADESAGGPKQQDVDARPEIADVHAQVRTQDAAGVVRGILSFPVRLETLSRALGMPWREAAQEVNQDTAVVVSRYASKLDFFALVNPFDETCVAECEACLIYFGAKGIEIESSWAGESLDSPKAYPLWEFAERRGATVFLHAPGGGNGHSRANGGPLLPGDGTDVDLAASVAGMIRAGVLDRYPRLQIVLSDLSGKLPARLAQLDRDELDAEGLQQDEPAEKKGRPSAYLRSNFHVATAGCSAAAVRQSIELLGADRVLFGSGYPMGAAGLKEQIDVIRSLGLSKKDETRILSGNAEALLKLEL